MWRSPVKALTVIPEEEMGSNSDFGGMVGKMYIVFCLHGWTNPSVFSGWASSRGGRIRVRTGVIILERHTRSTLTSGESKQQAYPASAVLLRMDGVQQKRNH